MLNLSERLVGYRRFTGLFFFGGALLLAGGVIASCLPDTSAPVLQFRATPGVDETSDVTIVTLPTLSPALEIAPFTDQACLDCHTDQETLVALAVEDKAPEALSSGPG